MNQAGLHRVGLEEEGRCRPELEKESISLGAEPKCDQNGGATQRDSTERSDKVARRETHRSARRIGGDAQARSQGGDGAAVFRELQDDRGARVSVVGNDKVR